MFKNEIFCENKVKRNKRKKKRAVQTLKTLTLIVRANVSRWIS